MNKRILKKLAIISCIPGILSCCSFADAMKNKENSSSQKSITAKPEKDIRKQTTDEVLKRFLSERKNKEEKLAHFIQKYANNEKPEKNIREKNTEEVLIDFLRRYEKQLYRKADKKSTNEMAKYTKIDEAMDILFDNSLSYNSSYRLHTAFNIFRDMNLDEKKDFIMRVFKHVNPDDRFYMDLDLKNFKLVRSDISHKQKCAFDRSLGRNVFFGDVITETLINGKGYINFIESQLEYWIDEPNNSKDGKISVYIKNDADLTEIRIGTGKNLFNRIKNNLWVISISA